MEPLAQVVLFLAVAVLGAALATRLGVLAPVLLVVVGLGLSLMPGFPHVRIHPDLVLGGLLPPLLYVAALETAVPAFRFNLRPILLLAVGLVLFTAFAVGLVTYALLPGVPFAACLALGAVVAPPDAVAATAVARRVGLPRRVVTILEGEGLVNDATALVLLRVTTAAALGSAVSTVDIAAEVVTSAGGGILIGAVGALVIGGLHARISDPILDNALSLLTPFLLVLVAETVAASSVVAVVVAGLALGHRMPVLMSAASRLQMAAFWRLVKFLLEGVVFLLVGAQLREVVDELEPPWGTIAMLTGAVLATVLVGRFVWIYPATYLARLVPRVRRRDPNPPLAVPTVIAWAGMRGVVTLAAALALPLTLADGAPYPRALFVWLALAVIVATLVFQGATLPVVAGWLRLNGEDRSGEVRAAAEVQREASRAVRDRLAALAEDIPPEVAERLCRRADERTVLARERAEEAADEAAEARADPARERAAGAGETPAEAYARLRRDMIDLERRVYRRARDDGRIPEEILVRAYHDLDLEESLLRATQPHRAKPPPAGLSG